MKKVIFLFFGICTAMALSAQIQWTHHIQEAKGHALSQDKLILIDFWASWCGPCKRMDGALWNSPKMDSMAKRVVFLKVDMDKHPRLARKFNVTAIPHVMLISANEDILWEETGFKNAGPYRMMIKYIPTDVASLNEHIIQLLHKGESPETLLRIAEAYQEIAWRTDYPVLQNAILKQSNSYLDKVLQKHVDPELAHKVELLSILNEAIRGKHKKAQKRLQKLAGGLISEDKTELERFVAAYCYKCEGNEEKLQELKSRISKPNYLAKLND